MNHENDHTMFVGVAVVLLNLETAELHLIDKIKYGFGDSEREIDEEKVKAAGFEMLGEL